MTGCGKGEIWLALPGKSVSETINTYWYYCEKQYKAPDKIVLLHPETTDKENYLAGFTAITDEFERKKKTLIRAVAFKEDNLNDFLERTTILLKKAEKKNLKMVIDISSTVMGFIPVALYNLSVKYNHIVKKMYYAEYISPEYRQKFYPLIPAAAFKVFNIFDELPVDEFLKP